jgi:hypothetical protein
MFRDTYKGYKNHSIKTLLANLEEGKQYPETGDSQDTQANSLCKVSMLGTCHWQSNCQASRGINWVLLPTPFPPHQFSTEIVVQGVCSLMRGSSCACVPSCSVLARKLGPLLAVEEATGMCWHAPVTMPTQACVRLVPFVLFWLSLFGIPSHNYCTVLFSAAASCHCCVRWL